MFLNLGTLRRPSSSSSITSAGSPWSDLDDIANSISSFFAADVTKCHRCPSPECPLLRDRQKSVSSVRSCEDMSVDKTQELWFCMLQLQERYDCYNSTRIDLALDAGDQAINFMPNRFIMDTLNNSLRDLPDEGWDQLNRCLDHQTVTEKPKSKRICRPKA
ncbi:hypothetical protein ACQRIT_000403 [Beauveria bassiana]